MERMTEWSGSPAEESPDDYWVDDRTQEYVDATTGERMTRQEALRRINSTNKGRIE